MNDRNHGSKRSFYGLVLKFEVVKLSVNALNFITTETVFSSTDILYIKRDIKYV